MSSKKKKRETKTEKRMSKQTYKICFCFKRKFRIKEAEIPSEIKDLFENYSENGLMNADHLHRFLKEVQGEEKLTYEEAVGVLESFVNEHKHLHMFHRKSLHIKEFFRYILSDSNAPLPYPPQVHQDMSCPLSHYFIYTGHNSYLTGNQISSDSSHEPIIDALKRGVRVIELDMWPNATKDDVDIMHGGTLTSPVTLVKCLSAIKEHAFVASDYPVIITLEDHLTPDLQAKVAKMCSQTFGDVLVCSTSDTFEEFPSPESLKGRIVISTKAPKEYLESKSSKVEDGKVLETKSSKVEDGGSVKVLETKSSKVEDGGSVKVDKTTEETASGRETSEIGVKVDKGCEDENDDQEQNAPTEYKQMIAIRAEKMKGGIKAWLKVNSQKAHRVSLNEEKLESAVLTHGTEIVRFNIRNLMRVYPKAMRIDSSNYDPFIGWMHGVQMVAFNMQGHGKSLWQMQGMFRANGGCGYVKKPDFLLKLGPNGEVFDPKKTLPVKTTLKVKVYMGEGWSLDFHRTHFDLFSPPDFYVKIGIAGVPSDSTKKKTKTLEDNWVPVWNEEFEFPLTVPELALLRIEVHEFDMSDKDDFGGQTCLPVSELKPGIRAVPLHDEKGDKYTSVRLLMRFHFL